MGFNFPALQPTDAGVATVEYALDDDCPFLAGGDFTIYSVLRISPAYLPYSSSRFSIEVTGTVQASGTTILCAFAKNGDFANVTYVETSYVSGTSNAISCDAPPVDTDKAASITHYVVSIAVDDDFYSVTTPIADSVLKLTYYSDPVVTAVTPAAVPERGSAQEITLRGTGFVNIPTTMQCRFGADAFSVGRRVSDTEAVCVCPRLNERAPISVSLNANITIRGPPGDSFIDVFAFQDISPAFLPITTGSTSVVLTGRYAAGVLYQCRFSFFAAGGVAAVPLVVSGSLSASTDAVTCPANFADALRSFSSSANSTYASLPAVIADVSIAAVGGIFPASGLSLTLHRAPRVVSITPSSLYAGSQANVLVNVESLDAILASSSSPSASLHLKCKFGSFEARGTRVTGANNTILCPSPNLEPSLSIRVEVSLNDGIHFTSSEPLVLLTVYRVLSVRPEFGTLIGGTNLNIVGSGFRAVNDITCTIGNVTIPATFKTKELV